MSTLQVMWEAVASDFSDLDAARAARVGTRLLMAAVFGGAIGFERQWKGKAAGLRTHMLVSLGAALFVVLPSASDSPDAVSRVIQGIAAGIGFLGAGAILKEQKNDRERVKGMTTAADIWLTAAIGVAAGLGRGATALLATLLALLILAILPRFERWATPKKPNAAPAPGEPPAPPNPAPPV
jgi:putative Mg2+ transporter-C (MgtC) family protein